MSANPPTFCVKLWKIDFFSKKTSTSSPPSPSKGGILNLFSSGSTLTPHDFNITVTAMSTSKQETVCEGGMVASEVKEVEGDGGMMCTELSFDSKSKKSILEVPSSKSLDIVECLEVKITASNIEDLKFQTSPPLNYRIIIHRSEHELNKALGSATSKIPGSKSSKTSIYPLLNHVYDEVGSVELDIIWGYPNDFLTPAKMESLIHESGKDRNNISSYSVDSDFYGMEDPMEKVRERMKNNKTWMSSADSDLGRDNFRPSRFGGTITKERAEEVRGEQTEMTFESVGARKEMEVEEEVFRVTKVRKPIAFEVEIGNKGEADKKGGGGFFSGAGGARAHEAKFLKKREKDWKKLREAKNMRVQLLREKKRKIIKSNRTKPLQERVIIKKKVEKMKVEKKGKPKRPVPKFSLAVAGKVMVKAEEEKKEGTPTPNKPKDVVEAWAHPPGFRETNLHGVIPTSAVPSKKIVSKAERELFSQSLRNKDKQKDSEIEEKIKRMVVQQKKVARGREERESAAKMRKVKAERREEKVRREKEEEMKARADLVKVRLEAFKMDRVMKAKEMQEKVAVENVVDGEKKEKAKKEGKKKSPKKTKKKAKSPTAPSLANSPYQKPAAIPTPIQTESVSVKKSPKKELKRRSTRLSMNSNGKPGTPVKTSKGGKGES